MKVRRNKFSLVSDVDVEESMLSTELKIREQFHGHIFYKHLNSHYVCNCRGVKEGRFFHKTCSPSNESAKWRACVLAYLACFIKRPPRRAS